MIKSELFFFYSSWAFDLYVVKVMMSSVITERRTLAQQFRQYFPSAALHTLTDVTRTHYDVSAVATGRILKYGISGDCVSRPEGQIEDLEEEFGTDVDYDVIDFAISTLP